MYDVANPALYHPNPRMWHAATVKDAAMFGPDNDTLVLRLVSEGLSHRHKYLLSAGYRHSYPQYEPHLTIKLGATEEDLIAVNAAIESGAFDAALPEGEVRLGGIIGNSRNTPNEYALLTEFARRLNTKLIAFIPRNVIVNKAENNRQTVIEYAPDSERAGL